MSDPKDKAAGILIGLAAGDLIGGPVSMAVTLSECLYTHRKFDVSLIGDAYLRWWNEEGFDTGPPRTEAARLP